MWPITLVGNKDQNTLEARDKGDRTTHQERGRTSLKEYTYTANDELTYKSLCKTSEDHKREACRETKNHKVERLRSTEQNGSDRGVEFLAHVERHKGRNTTSVFWRKIHTSEVKGQKNNNVHPLIWGGVELTFIFRSSG